MMYSGDEFFGDDITSGPIVDDEMMTCSCGHLFTDHDRTEDVGYCTVCPDEDECCELNDSDGLVR